MKNKIGCFAAILALVAIVFAFVKLKSLADESDKAVEQTITQYLNKVQKGEFEKAYSEFLSPEMKSGMSLETYLSAQKRNSSSLGALKNIHLLQIRNGPGFVTVNEFTAYFDLTYTAGPQSVVIKIKRAQEGSNTFLINGIFKGSPGQKAFLNEAIY